MKQLPVFFLSLFILGCRYASNNTAEVSNDAARQVISNRSYKEIKDSIVINRKKFYINYPSLASLSKKERTEALTDFWVNNIGNELYCKWQNTPWDFNGNTTVPNQGTIACGYFVTTMLRDMDCKIDRSKLAVCASSLMMKSLTPHQSIRNLSYLSYPEFNNALKAWGKGIYIIGLDFHTGFIINDGKETWFLHSNYIKRRGVMKEAVINSAALRSSKTRWMISLTGDKEFLYKWLRG